MLLEAGGADNNVWIHTPHRLGKLLTNPKFAWQDFTKKGDPPVAGEVYWPTGRTLGGSSSVNGMVFVRGTRKA